MWRGISYRTLALLLIGPLLADLLVMCCIFWMTVQAVRMGQPPRSQAWIGGLFALGYVCGTLTAGRRLTPRRAQWMVLAVIPLIAMLNTGAMLSRSFEAYLGLALLTGLTAGHYFAPFQVMMGHVRPFHTLAWTIAFYNISWGSGYTLGPLLSGFAGTSVLAGDSQPRQAPAILLLVWALAVVHTVLALAARSAPRGAADPAGKTIAFRSTGRMRASGYVAAGMVTLVLSGVLATLWPNLGAARGLGDRHIALGGALLAAPTPLLAMAWARLRYHMIRPWMLMAIVILGAAAVLAVPGTRGWATYLCLLCVGISLSGSVFHGIYYCNADPNAAARAVTLYEAVIGAANFVGPVLLGMTAWEDRASARPYVLGSLLLVGAAAAVGWIRRIEPSINADAPAVP